MAANQEFSEFVKTILGKLESVKKERSAYYDAIRSNSAIWANNSRRFLAAFGSIAFLLTACAAALRIAPEALLERFGARDADKFLLLAVLAIYAIMGTMSFYERATEKTTAYFRHLGIILSIRDLWTKIQFEILKELMAAKGAAPSSTEEAAARERIRSLAEAFCNDMNKVTSVELAEWRTEFLASLSYLEEAARKGTEREVQELVKVAEKAATDAQAAASVAEQGISHGVINVHVLGDFDSDLIIFVDDIEAEHGTDRTFVLTRMRPGYRKISVIANRDARRLRTAKLIELKPGEIGDVELTLA